MKVAAWMRERLRARGSPRSAAVRQMLQAVNRTRESVLANSLEVAATGDLRRKGLLGRTHLAPGGGLWIVPCESVHTFFMRFAIDLVYLDRRNRVRKVRRAVAPWRVSACFGAHSVLELVPGTIKRTGTAKGDELEFLPAADCAGDELTRVLKESEAMKNFARSFAEESARPSMFTS